MESINEKMDAQLRTRVDELTRANDENQDGRLDAADLKAQLNRIEAQHELDNPASGRVMEKCGMRCEGTLRQRVFNKGRFSDVRLYAILRGDGVPGNEHI